MGVDQTAVFTMIDKITNAISDSCEPLIIPDIAPQAVGDKTVIVVEISAGSQRPYLEHFKKIQFSKDADENMKTMVSKPYAKVLKQIKNNENNLRK